MERKNFAQLYINNAYKGVIEVVSETNNFIDFREVGQGLKVFYLPKRDNIKVINFKNVEV